MALTRQQYDSLMQAYADTRDRHRRELLRRRDYVYAKIPAYRELEASVPALGLDALRKSLGSTDPQASSGDPADSSADRIRTAYEGQVLSIRSKKRALLAQAGLPANYLDMTYDCPDCLDTGYQDGKKCHCLRSKEIHILYGQSHLQELARENNFRLLSEEWYQGEDLAHFRNTVRNCGQFVNNFDSGYENLFFYGTVGTGKSFLSISTANEVLRRGHSVIYFSAAGLFDAISTSLFDYKNRDEYRQLSDDLYGCDLLVIDDLGTEMMTNLVTSQLFTCINERHIQGRSTIISSNLSLEELQQRYSERVYSRIISSYTICKLTGPDIRVLKKVRKRTNGSTETT